MNMWGIPREELSKGYVLCPLVEPLRAVSKFKAQLQILELPEERPVHIAGYKAVIHCHVSIEECEIFKLYDSTDPKNKLRNNKHKSPSFVREGWAVVCSIALARPIVVDFFQNISTLCRFTLRDDGRIIVMGGVTELTKEKWVDFIIYWCVLVRNPLLLRTCDVNAPSD